MKKLLSKIALLGVTASLVACGGGGNGGSGNSDRQLILGTNEMNGSFIDGWGNNSYDKHVKDMVSLFSEPFIYTADGEYLQNKQITESYETSDDADGNRTYTIKIKDGLKWSDGEPLTAKDYAFAILVDASRAIVDNEGSMDYPSYFLGYEDYNNIAVGDPNEKRPEKTYDPEEMSEEEIAAAKAADAKVTVQEENPAFKAIGYDEANNSYSVTVDASNIPYFYELLRIATRPYPSHVIAPDAKVEQTDAGAKITGATLTEISDTVTNEYRTNPSVSAGAYKFMGFKDKQVELELNENFAGDLDGNKPSIKNILIKTVDSARDVDTLLAGEVDVILGVVEGAKIEKATADEKIQESQYDRHGFGIVPLSTYHGATKDPAVRRAIAHLINKQDLVTAVTGGYGQVAYGYWSKVQWMYTENADKLNDESVINKYSYNIEAANKELDNSSYKFEADGSTPYDSSKASADYLRYNDKGEVLSITHMGSENNVVTDTLEAQFRAGYPKVGAKYEVRVVDFATLLTTYYGKTNIPEAERANSFNMAVGFTPAFDPVTDLHGRYANTPSLNPSGINDEELNKLIEEMQQCEPGDNEKYSEIWMRFQARYNELMPVIPTYANTYYDFATADLEGFETGPIYDLAHIVSRLSWK